LKTSKKLVRALKGKLKPGPERGGLIQADGSLLEFNNVAEVPTEGFLPEITTDLLGSLDASIGTWHTHPGATANLSAEDWTTFVQWPDHIHVIVGTDGLRWYRVEKNAVLNA
jgi:hypothetical protein